MGLNMNYNLFLNDNNEKINSFDNIKSKYIPTDKSNYVSEAYTLHNISEFNDCIREAKQAIQENEREIDSRRFAIDKTLEGVKRIMDMIIFTLEQNLRDVKCKALEIQKDYVEEKFPQLYQRVEELSKALANEEINNKSVYIRSIDPLELPKVDTSIIGNDLVNFIDDFEKDIEINVDERKNIILRKLFGIYDYDSTNLTLSRIEAGRKLYNYESEPSDVPMTTSLYLMACTNLAQLDDQEKVNALIRDLEEEITLQNKNYARLYTAIEKARDTNVGVTVNKTGERIYLDLIGALNVINEIVNVQYGLSIDRARKFIQIIEDSIKVKLKAHDLISDNLHLGVNEEIINAKEFTNEYYEIQDDFNIALELIDEAFKEQDFNNFMDQVLLENNIILKEGEGDASSAPSGGDQGGSNAAPAAADAAQTTPPQNNQQTTVTTTTNKDRSQKVYEVVNKILGALGNTFKKFADRINTLNYKDYWNKNKDAIQKLQLTDTVVNQWYSYDTDLMKNSTYIKFEDPNNPNFQNDKAMQDAIIKKIKGVAGANGNAEFKEEDTFAQKITKIYQGKYTENQNGGETLNAIGFDSEKAFNYTNDFIQKGFSSDALGSVKTDYESISKDHKDLKNKYQGFLDQMKSQNNAETTTTTTTQTTQVSTGEPQKATAEANVDSDFKFNLAEHFGLMDNHIIPIGEAQVTSVGAADRAQAAANGGESARDKKNAELDARIARCYRYNTTAITAKMTASIAAFKQYMGLYRAVYKNGGNTPQEQQTTTVTQNTNTTEQQNTEQK